MQLEPSNDSQIVKNIIPAHLQPFAKPPPPVALEEDEYIEGISSIIERDFFPDLKKLRVQNHLLEAVNNSDNLRAEYFGHQLAELTGKIPSTPLPQDGLTTSSLDTSLTLDNFQAKYTSEDNESFAEIIERTNREKKEKYHWFYDTEGKQSLLTNAEQDQLIDEHISKPVIAWDHKARSALMYGPEGLPFTPHDIPKTRAGPKRLVHSATRLKNPNQVDVELEVNSDRRRALKTWDDIALATPGLFRNDSTPIIAGYKLVPQTPEMRPNIDIDPSELMTWGVVESTPIRIESGPIFSMQPASKREIIANKLSEKVAASIRKKSSTPRFKTPLSRGVSPAVIELSKTLRRSNGLDLALRSTYQMTPKTKASSRRTPSVFTDSTSTPTIRIGTPLANTNSLISIESVSDKNMTDDLLNI